MYATHRRSSVVPLAVLAAVMVSLGLVGTQIVQLRKEVYRIQMENRRLERMISDEKR